MEVNKQDDYSLTIPLLITNGDVGTKGKEEQYTNNTATGTASFISTCFNALNALSGVGILSIPYALASGGWLTLILLLVIASSTFFTGLLIQRCMDSDPTIRTYPDIGERAFGKAGRTLISISMNIELYLVATGFLILEGDNLCKLFPDIDFDIYGTRIGSKTAFIVIIAILILPTSLLNDMSILSYISASGVLASVIILSSVFWAGVFDGIGFQEKGNIVKWNGVPSAISLYAFCYCAHPVFSHPIYFHEKATPILKGLVLLFCLFYDYLLINGSYRLPYVWVESRVRDYVKPPYQQDKFKGGNIHHPRYSNS
ncbi:unnamed protein product [Lactuca saligna]|uniref:Amino acid transporter transmembrane domain-containing protein n=1 Tax=Lactuca saligna TaxID=75948 RepID=A0AA36E4X8_LACSI|nr:unnamed protein product [Lactuca saligna]